MKSWALRYVYRILLSKGFIFIIGSRRRNFSPWILSLILLLYPRSFACFSFGFQFKQAVKRRILKERVTWAIHIRQGKTSLSLSRLIEKKALVFPKITDALFNGLYLKMIFVKISTSLEFLHYLNLLESKWRFICFPSRFPTKRMSRRSSSLFGRFPRACCRDARSPSTMSFPLWWRHAIVDPFP